MNAQGLLYLAHAESSVVSNGGNRREFNTAKQVHHHTATRPYLHSTTQDVINLHHLSPVPTQVADIPVSAMQSPPVILTEIRNKFI